jgi:hypothetical protein
MIKEVENKLVELLISKPLDSLSMDEEYELSLLMKQKFDLLALEE